MNNSRYLRPARGFSFLAFLAVLVVAAPLVFLASSYRRWEGQAPQIAFDRDFAVLGRTPALNLTVEDAGSGLQNVTIRLAQAEQEIVLAEDVFPGPERFKLWTSGPEKSKSYDIGALILDSYQIQQGPARLTIAATDYSLRGFFSGNRVESTQEFEFDIYPPRLETLSGQHYINQGGSQLVLYRVSEDAEVSGVQVGPHFFPGFPANNGDAGARFSLFAFSYDLPADTPVTLMARDAGGYESVAGFWYRITPRAFRQRQIAIDDSLLQKVVPEIMAQTPGVSDRGALIDTFVEINSTLRQRNHETIAELAAQSEGRFLWNGPFLQLSNSQVEAFFADRRTYMYNGNAVDRQDHVGFDLAVTERYPVEAANDGRVILAEYFGIYGNTVLIDHGAGLISLYGHMSSIGVQAGQPVKKGDTLGRSGATGLAGGDHLHFGMFLHGVPVNPTEWWDAKWIQDHVLDRMQAAP